MSSIDVIVVCWNDRHNITKALESVFALDEVESDPSFAHVVVSDNGSTDGSREFIRERYGQRVEIIENGANIGFAAACNRAFERTSSPYVYLLNPDAELKNGALREIVAFMDAHPRCGIAGSRIYNLDGTIQRDAVGEFDTWTGAFLRSSAWGEWPMFRRYANGASLRDWDYGSRAARRHRDRCRAGDPADAFGCNRTLRRAFLPVSRGSRFGEARSDCTLGNVVRPAE